MANDEVKVPEKLWISEASMAVLYRHFCDTPQDGRIEYVRAYPTPSLEVVAREIAEKYFVKVLASIDAAKNSPLASERIWAGEASKTTRTAMNALEAIIHSTLVGCGFKEEEKRRSVDGK